MPSGDFLKKTPPFSEPFGAREFSDRSKAQFQAAPGCLSHQQVSPRASPLPCRPAPSAKDARYARSGSCAPSPACRAVLRPPPPRRLVASEFTVRRSCFVNRGSGSVVRVARENCTCAIDLLRHHQARQRVRQRHRPQREHSTAAFGLRPSLVGPSIRRPDRKDHVLRSLVAALSQPQRQFLRAHLPSAAIKQHQQAFRPAALMPDPFQHRLFAVKSLGPASYHPSAALQIVAH